MTQSHPHHNLHATLVVGLEIHVELATRSKMWTSAPNVAHPDYFDAAPNTLLSPVVIGMPGTLPVINKAAIEMSIAVGLALHCKIARQTKWDRKSYYYPDLPKNYQISQYDLPLCYDGSLDLPDGQRISILRAHLEEDAGKLLHEAPGGTPIDYSIVDLNRAGTPLLEIVTEPDFRTADQVVSFCQSLRDICRHLGVTQGIMQRGHMRFEPNINLIIEREGNTYKTPIVEIKNLNSFRAVHGAITCEYERQIEAWIKTGQTMGARAKSTRGWDDVKCITTPQREKEDADEYRYFPDPDLVDVHVDDDWLNHIQSTLVELPQARQTRYRNELKLNEKDTRALLEEPKLCHFLDAICELGASPPKAATLLLNYGVKHANERKVQVHELAITAQHVADLLALVEADKIGSSAADQLFGLCCHPQYADTPAETLAQQEGLLQVSDSGALEAYIDQVLGQAKNAKIVDDIKAGKGKAIGALLGQIMQLSKGQANPKRVRDMIQSKLQ